MDGYARIKEMKWFTFICCIVFCIAVGTVHGDSPADVEPTKTEDQLKLEEKAKEDQQKQAVKTTTDIGPEEVSELVLPDDTSPLMVAREISIIGNTLITTEDLLASIPSIYNASGLPLKKARSSDLYDFRPVRDLIEMPGQSHQISARTIRGLTRCILGIYNKRGYSGIFVSVPPAALKGEKLRGDVLLIKVTEAPVVLVTTDYFTPENESATEGEEYLDDSFLRKWSPAKAGEVGNQKKLEDYINLLNLNPDRHIVAKVSRGTEPNTLAVGYNIYEANPWHWFMQVDNAGTKDRRYAPRIGLINTNLLGMDDTLTVFHQAPWDGDFFDNYSVYASYDFPILGPALRIRAFGAYSEFSVDGGAGIDFLGNGLLYGGELRYNVLQKDGWFLDFRSSLSHEHSEVSSSIFSAILGSEVDMLLWGIGTDLHRRTDMSNTTLSFDRTQNIGGSGQNSYWNSSALTGARTNAERDFSIYDLSAQHSWYLNPDKVQRISGSFQWIIPTERLVPAKMTTFGGMYTVRGYEESGIVADGGILASAQYEFDLVKHEQSQDVYQAETDEKPFVRKLAPLGFFDYGRAKIEDKVPGEEGVEELYSIGPGAIVELGDNFMGVVYYGFPLKSTSTTDTHDGKLNFSVMLRW